MQQRHTCCSKRVFGNTNVTSVCVTQHCVQPNSVSMHKHMTLYSSLSCDCQSVGFCT